MGFFSRTDRSVGRRIATSLILVLVAMLFARLGVWQLDRSAEKSREFERAQQRETLAPLEWPWDSFSDPKDAEFRQVKVRGRFRTDHIIYIDSQKWHDRPGYHVVVPLNVAKNTVLLANLGWLPLVDGRRDRLPAIALPDGPVELLGQLVIQKKGIHPGIPYPGAEARGVWLYMDIDYFEQKSGLAVLPWVLQTAPDKSSQFMREWSGPQANNGMHLAYAVQWFVFAGFMIVGLIWYLRNGYREEKRPD